MNKGISYLALLHTIKAHDRHSKWSEETELQCYRNVLEKDDYAWAKKNVLLWRSREPDKEVGPGKHRIRWIVNKDMNDFHLKMSYAMDYQKIAGNDYKELEQLLWL